ncbi:MAG TPA: L,D-transpeptidase family protein [Pyrinomonadaceae bacterium]
MRNIQDYSNRRRIDSGSGFKATFRLLLSATLMLNLCLITTTSFAITKKYQRKGRTTARVVARPSSRPLTRAEMKAAEERLAEMGYGTGPVDGVIDSATQSALVAFQKWEGRTVTGRLSRDDVNAIMNANAPRPRDAGYKHVEVDLDRQVLLLTDDSGAVQRVLPVSSGSNKRYREKGASGLAYTPRGRFRINAKIAGWRKSPLGLLYYPSYFSGGVAIHGNPSVPNEPESHGCVRIPMSAAVEMYNRLPVGTIVLVYDQRSFVSAKDWAKEDQREKDSDIR